MNIELSDELKTLTKCLQRIEGAIRYAPDYAKEETEYVMQEGVDKLSAQVTKCETVLVAFQDNLKQKESEVYLAYEEAEKKIKRVHTDVTKKINDLPKFTEINIPHNIDKIFAIAERFDKMPDEQFTRVLELAIAMRSL